MAALGLQDTRGWNNGERNALRAVAAVLAQIPDLRTWPARDKRRLIALVRAKGGDECRNFTLMARFRRLRDGLKAVAANSGT